MIRRRAIVLSCASLVATAFLAGCGSGTVATSTPDASSGEPSYGENKLPPPDQVAPKKGQGARSPGRPPQQR